MERTVAILIVAMGIIQGSIAQEADTTEIILPKNAIGIIQDISPKVADTTDVIIIENEELQEKKAPYTKFIVPTALVSYGLITRVNKPLKELDHSTHDEICEHLHVKIPIDDYSQFAPVVAVYGLDLIGIKAAHNFKDRTFIVATSYIIMGQVVGNMKKGFGIERPDGSNKRSFPSGHTATAFVGAHILFKEYKETSLWIGMAGYAVAAGTGILRVLNKKHWVSDVVTGAGVGMLCVETSYLLLPVFHKVFSIKESSYNLVVVPSIGMDNYGIGLAYSF
ncbi:MAG: phosphatase PAP2 family protein [Proteiniphilum sp.]